MSFLKYYHASDRDDEEDIAEEGSGDGWCERCHHCLEDHGGCWDHSSGGKCGVKGCDCTGFIGVDGGYEPPP